jgi:hypothetical protein
MVLHPTENRYSLSQERRGVESIITASTEEKKFPE